jgi:4-amino-4-deoxy-L-arabinose transferase-like glycosyltransferase
LSGFPAKHLLAAPLVFLLFFYGLTTAGLLGPDEPRYASIGREMAVSGDWITPTLWSERWFEKPPLLYWLIGLGFKAGLSDDLAPRLPVALLSAGFILLFFHQIRREFGEKAALYGCGILATSAGWLAYSHVAVTDIPLATTFSSALLLSFPWVRSGGRRGLLAAGVLLGFAVLAKGLVPLVLIAPLLWIAGRRWADLLILAGATIVVAAPWYVLCYIHNGSVFIDEFFWKHHFARFATTELQHVQPWWFYVPVLIGLLFPWSPVLALIPHRTKDNRRKLLLLVIAFGLVFFSAATNKLPGYLLPLLPAIAAVAGVRLTEIRDIRIVLGLSAAFLIAIPLIAGTLPEALARGLGAVDIAATGWLAVLPMAALAGAVLWLAQQNRRQYAIATAVLAATLGVVYLKSTMFPELDRVVSARPLWLKIRDDRDQYCIGDLHRNVRYGLNYYSHQPLPECRNEPDRKRLDREIW